MTVEVGRQIASVVFLGVLAMWAINGAAMTKRRTGIDNLITFEIGAVFFGLAFGFYQAAHGGNAAWRVTYFIIVGCALFVTLLQRFTNRNR